MKRFLPHILMAVVVCATTVGIGLVTKNVADEGLRLAVEDIEADCDDQLTLLLHVDAFEFAERCAATNNLSLADFRQLSESYRIDEFTLVGADGRILLTTDPGTKAGEPFFTDEGKHAPYRELLDGRCTMVRQRFRASATCADRAMKYFAMAIPESARRGVRNTAHEARFLQIGFLWESFEREFANLFLPLFETRRVSETGYCLILDENDVVEANVAGHSDAKGKTAAEIGFTPDDLSVPLGEVFRPVLFGERCRCMAYPERIAGMRVYAAMPIAEELVSALVLAGGVDIVLVLAFIVFRLVLKKFKQQQAKIDALRAEEEKRRAADLALARAIQCAELRTDGTEGDGYRIATSMNAAREVGGDFYDYYELPDGRLVVTIADVSGKGVPAAFFMMKARMTLKSCVYSSPMLAEAVAKANQRLAANNPAEMFVTAWVGIYDRKTGTLDYVSAGHNPPLVKGSDGGAIGDCALPMGSVRWLEAPRAAALGVFEMAKYRGARTMLMKSDRLFLYTDGVTEAMNKAGELFGNARLEATVGGAVGDGTPTLPLVPVVKEAVETFVAGAEQSDDITMLELEIT